MDLVRATVSMTRRVHSHERKINKEVETVWLIRSSPALLQKWIGFRHHTHQTGSWRTIQNIEEMKVKIAYLERAMDKETWYRYRINFESRIEIWTLAILTDRDKFRDHHTEWRKVNARIIMGLTGEVWYKNSEQWEPTQRWHGHPTWKEA